MIKRVFIVIGLLCGLCSFSQESEIKIEKLESTENNKLGNLLFAKKDLYGGLYTVSRTTGLSKLAIILDIIRGMPSF